MQDATLQSLTQAAAGGDRDALRALVRRYLPRLRAFVRARHGAAFRARESSCDVVQSVCRELLTQASRFRHPDEDAFVRWLFTMTSRKLKDRRDYHLAERRDVAREAAGGDAHHELVVAYSGVITPSAEVAAREQVERIERALDGLPEEYREVITLSRLAGLSRAAVADAMGRSEASVRMLLHRALARLADDLAAG